MALTTLEVGIGAYTIRSISDGLPTNYAVYARHAQLVDETALDDPELSKVFFAAVSSTGETWPKLVIAQRYGPEAFNPGVLLVQETHLLFVGAGERLAAYDLDKLERLWVHQTDVGFWRWARYGDYVLMSAELEFAAWDVHGQKQWAMFVEPPWAYDIQQGEVHLTVMNDKTTFPLASGPGQHTNTR
jgi:hypothetical protein